MLLGSQKRPPPQKDVEMSPADFISMEVSLRVRNLSDIQRYMLIRLYTEGKVLIVSMAKQLLTFFL